MKIDRKIILIPLFFISVTGCAVSGKIQTSKTKKNETSKLLNQDVMSVLWYQQAAEARALYYQAFNIARYRLNDILKQDTAQKKLAIIVDIDETVLNNSPYQAMTIKDNAAFPQGWNKWLASASARATPGAVSFLNYVSEHGVDIYYISNRSDSMKGATIQNLKDLGFPQVNPGHVLLEKETSDKTERRHIVAETHDIALLCGDNLGDFAQFYQGQQSNRRNLLVDSTKSNFGKRYIILPNPMYGEWEGAVYDYKWNKSDSEKAVLRKESLHSFHLKNVDNN